MNLSENTLEDKLGLILFSIGFLFLLIMTYTGLTTLNTWYDCTFSMRLSQLPLSQLIVEGINDVHPIFYYLLYKVFINIFEVFNVTNIVFIGKFVSLLPMYLIVLVSLLKVKKRFGMLTAGIFTFCIIAMPYIPKFMVEIRMYSWALFFVTTSLIYVNEIINENKIKYWIILIILTVCGANTHYFAALSLFVIYAIFLTYILLKNKDLLKNFIFSAITSIVLYLPWMPSLLKQFNFGKSGYWVSNISTNSFIEIYYFFSPIFHDEPKIIASLLIISIIILISYSLYNRKDDMEFAFIAIATYVLVILASILFSILVFPVFNLRFLFPVFGCLWLGIAILLARINNNKKLFYGILIVLIVIGSLSVASQVNSEHTKYNNTIYSNETVQNIISPNDTVIYIDYPTYVEFSTYSLKNSNNILCTYDKIGDNINKYNNTNIYLISTDKNPLNESLNNNITIKEVHSFEDPCYLNAIVKIYKPV